MREAEYQKIGDTRRGEAIYQNLETGVLYIEIDFERLVKASVESLEGAEFKVGQTVKKLMKSLGLSQSKKMVNVHLTKNEGKAGTLVYVVDSKGTLLHTEPLCLIYSAYFPAFFNWLQEKFREDSRLTHVLPQVRNSEGGKG